MIHVWRNVALPSHRAVATAQAVGEKCPSLLLGVVAACKAWIGLEPYEWGDGHCPMSATLGTTRQTGEGVTGNTNTMSSTLPFTPGWTKVFLPSFKVTSFGATIKRASPRSSERGSHHDS